MNDAPRITAQEARPKLQVGEALLVCAYEQPEKFAAVRLEGAISFQEFRAMEPTLSKEKEIIFYCA